MPSRRQPLSELLDVPVFTTAEALAAGVGRRRLSGPELIRLSRGVYAIRDSGATELDAVTAYQRSFPGTVACGLTALRLLGMPTPPGMPTWELGDPRFGIHLSYPASHRHHSGQLRWSRLDLAPDDIVTVDGVRVTSRPRTLLDLARNVRSFTIDDLVAIADHLVRKPRPEFERRSTPFASIEALQRSAARHRGRGAHRLREALELAVVGSDSPAETRLRLALLRAGLPTPQLNVRIREDGVDLGQPDLSWPQWRVCIEHEGPHHRTSAQQEKDIERGELRRDLGWVEVQTTARDLRQNGARAVVRTEAKLRQNGWPGGAAALSSARPRPRIEA